MSRESYRRGLVVLVVAALLFGLMAFVAKHATARVGGAQAAFVRFLVGAAVTFGQASVRRVPLRVVRWRFLVYRGLFGGVAVLLYFLAIEHLPSGTATLLNYTAPVFTATFAYLFLAEPLGVGTIAAFAVAAMGVVMVIYGEGKALGGAWAWLAIGLCSAVASGGAVTSIRAARRTDGSWEVFAAFCVLGAVVCAPFAAATWTAPTGTEWIELLLVGIIAVGAQILMTYALGHVDAATAGVISQITVVTAFALGITLDGDPMSELSAAGSLLTVAGVSVAALVGTRSATTRTLVNRAETVQKSDSL